MMNYKFKKEKRKYLMRTGVLFLFLAIIIFIATKKKRYLDFSS